MLPFTQKDIMRYMYEVNDDAQTSQKEHDRRCANEVNRTQQRMPR